MSGLSLLVWIFAMPLMGQFRREIGLKSAGEVGALFLGRRTIWALLKQPKSVMELWKR